MGSHVLSWCLPWQRSIFTLTKSVYCIFASTRTCLWDVRVISFFQTCQGTIAAPEQRPRNLSLLLLWCKLTVNYPISTNIKVCVYLFYFLSNPRGFPTVLPPSSLIYHQWISCNLFTTPPLIVMYKIRLKTAILWSIFSIHWKFASGQLSVWLR